MLRSYRLQKCSEQLHLYVLGQNFLEHFFSVRFINVLGYMSFISDFLGYDRQQLGHRLYLGHRTLECVVNQENAIVFSTFVELDDFLSEQSTCRVAYLSGSNQVLMNLGYIHS